MASLDLLGCHTLIAGLTLFSLPSPHAAVFNRFSLCALLKFFISPQSYCLTHLSLLPSFCLLVPVNPGRPTELTPHQVCNGVYCVAMQCKLSTQGGKKAQAAKLWVKLHTSAHARCRKRSQIESHVNGHPYLMHYFDGSPTSSPPLIHHSL